MNADDADGRMVWAGVNAAGFAVVNSVAYNLPQKTGEQADLEGIIMADALRSCATVADFERYLKENLGPDLGVAGQLPGDRRDGGAAIFESHNHGYKRLDAATRRRGTWSTPTSPAAARPTRAPATCASSARRRCSRPRNRPAVTPAWVLQTAARDLGHPLLQHPARADWKKLPADRPTWIHTNYTIDRGQHGERHSDPRCEARRGSRQRRCGSPSVSRCARSPSRCGWRQARRRRRRGKGDDAPLAAESLRLKDLLRPLKARERREYPDLARLDNAAGTGWLPSLLAAEADSMTRAAALLAKNPPAAELAAFQKTESERALALLKAVK